VNRRADSPLTTARAGVWPGTWDHARDEGATVSEEETVYVTGAGAATRAGEWLRRIEKRYMEDLAQEGEQDFQIEAALAQGWATLAVALRP